jgi:methionyl-tRNA formyltransferase
VLTIPSYGCINVHASLLPRWRGAAPVQRAILAGDTTTGVSIMLMNEGLDTGPCDQVVSLPIDDLNAEALTAQLAEAGARALLQTLRRVERGEVQWTAQDDSLATYADKVTRADVTPSPGDPLVTAVRKIRASSAQAPSRIMVGGRGVTLLNAAPAEVGISPGKARPSPTGLELGLSDGSLLVTRLKPDGKTAIDAAAWLRGARLPDVVEWTPA